MLQNIMKRLKEDLNKGRGAMFMIRRYHLKEKNSY